MLTINHHRGAIGGIGWYLGASDNPASRNDPPGYSIQISGKQQFHSQVFPIVVQDLIHNKCPI